VEVNLSRILRRFSTMAIALAAISMFALTTPSSASPNTRHCVVQVVGQRASGELITSPMNCFDTFREAMAATGVPGATSLREGATSAELAAVNSTSSLSSIIGTHYEFANNSGSSISVSGTTCTGGWTNLSASWQNRISSTANGCPRIRHFASANATGIWEDTTGAGGNLTLLDNLADSIQYLS
jgi:hypothetical protein